MQVHGIPVERKIEDAKYGDERLSQDEKIAMDVAMKRAKERKRLEYGRKTSNKD